MNEQAMAWILLIVGLCALVAGGELLVRGASAIATAFRISPLVIGLTVVAFGTSAPELGVSLRAAFSGAADVAVGNVVGSNIFNVLLILGISALITPLLVSSQLIRLDVPVMVGLSALSWILLRDGLIGRLDGIILFSILIIYIGICIRGSRRESQVVKEEFDSEYGTEDSPTTHWSISFGLIIFGLILLGFGSKWLVDGAVSIATWFGVSQLVIGLTIVAVGTSLPEVVTSVVASVRGARDIAVGNVVGSNIFNLACVLGMSGIIAKAGIPVSEQAIWFDVPVMVLVAVVCLPIFITGKRIGRLEGVLFLVAFFAYTAYLISQ